MISEAPCLDAQKKILKHIHKSISFDKSKNSFIDLEKYIRIPIKYIKHAHSLLVPGLDSILMSEEDNNKNSPPESELGPVVKDSQLSEFYISAAYSLFPEDKPGHEFKERAVLELRDWVREKGSETEIFRYRVPKNIGIEIPTTSFKPLFKRLSAKNVVRLLKCILLERKLIFFSSQPDEIPYITQALLSMLWPLQWCCLYVPRLPIAIWETLHAIMPYIVGLPSQYKEFVRFFFIII